MGRSRARGPRLIASGVVLALLAALVAAVAPPAAAVQVIDVQISASADDAEEIAAGTDLSSSDLELARDGSDDQTIGLRFTSVDLANGVGIASAYVQFTVDEVSQQPTELTIRGELSPDAAQFTTAIGDLSGRSPTTASVVWNPPAWNTVGQSGSAQRTADLRPIIQEIVDQPGWASGNALVLTIEGDGSGKRTAEAYDGEPTGAPVLHVVHGVTPGNTPPVADAGPDRFVTEPVDTICVAGDASDDGIPGTLDALWSQTVGPPGVAFDPDDAATTSVSFPGPGSYTLELGVDDGELSGSDSTKIAVGRIIDVPGDAPTIQAGVDMAVDGDTVLVGPGTWFENVSIAQKTITLASHYLLTGDPADRDATVIDGGGLQFAVSFDDVGPQSRIVGLTVRNANDGILMASPVDVLHNRVLSTFDALEYKNHGGGTARGNILEWNNDDGVDINRDGAVVVEQNIIRNNLGDGVEIRLNDWSGPLLTTVIRDNLIHDNADDGIQLIDYDSETLREFFIERNLILDNDQAGIGIMGNGVTSENYEGASATEAVWVTNNVIIGNDHGITGGDNMTARNNVVAGHTNIAVKNIDGGSSVTHNLFWDNGTDIVNSNVELSSTVFADPLLDASNEPLAGSPAIDAGTDVGEPYAGVAPDIGFVETPVNASPSVDAGADVSKPWSALPVALNGVIADDDLPNGAGTVSAHWSQLTGACGVTFAADAAATTATFPGPGIYELRLTGDDGWEVAHDEVVVTLTDEIVITPGATSVSEGDSGSTVVQLPVQLSAPAPSPVTIDWATIDVPANPQVAASGADYVAASGTVTFDPGETTQTVPIEVLGDTAVEPPLLWGEWLLVRFQNPSPNASLYLGFFGVGVLVILDDD